MRLPHLPSSAKIAGALFVLAALLLISLIPRSNPTPVEPTPYPGRRPVQSLYRLQAAALRDGWTAEALEEAGDLSRVVGEVDRAAAYWEAALRDDPGNVRILRLLAETYLELQQWSRAADTLARMAERDAYPEWAAFQLGLIYSALDPGRALSHLEQSGSYAETVAGLLAALRENPTPVRTGIALADAELWAYAELAFSQADTAEALAYTGLARDRQGKDGSVWIERAVAVAPQNGRVRFLQGLHLRHTRDDVGSLTALTQAVALEPENPAFYAELGAAYELVDDLESAERWLREAVAVSNGDPRFQTLLDQFTLQQRDLFAELGLTDEPNPLAASTPSAGG